MILTKYDNDYDNFSDIIFDNDDTMLLIYNW